jgi:hypothetical protein
MKRFANGIEVDLGHCRQKLRFPPVYDDIEILKIRSRNHRNLLHDWPLMICGIPTAPQMFALDYFAVFSNPP